MKTKEIKVSIKMTVPKAVIDRTDGPYFYNIGFENEAIVVKNEVENGIEAWFEGFELLPGRNDDRPNLRAEEMVTAKLHYTVLVEVV